MQLHLSPLRNNNKQMFHKIGPDSGFDSIGDLLIADKLSGLLDALEQKGKLPKTILYSLNARDYDVLASMAGNYQNAEVPGKVQFGTAWWFNDTIDGMEDQMKTLANIGLISNFIGMLTDSRSFLSFSRHEYFRRILCNLLGSWAEEGKVPKDMTLLKQYV
jgi:glucuronate isomerase